MSKFYITNAIPYVNAKPHLGHALELVQTDTIARYHRSVLEDETFFLFGTDENALKNVQSAEEAGEDVKSFVDRHVQIFRDLTKKLNISNDDFIRTTEQRNIDGTQKLWKACDANGDIYTKNYKGLYCVPCEAFYTEKDLVNGLCPEHKKKPEIVEEENYFFKLSKYQDQLLKLIESDELKITPETKKNEVTKFIKSGLEDISISRSRERAKNWGISVPGDDNQIIYVWIDALSNYINALDYGTNGSKFKKWWETDKSYKIHAIGKGIARFHAIYWPAMLLSAGVKIPNEILIHGYITIEGEKISKTLGNVIDPLEPIGKYGLDPVRYYLLRDIPSTGDGDFSYSRLEKRYTGDLANNLGNLVSRVAKLIDSKLTKKLDYRNKFASKRVLNEIEKTQTVYHRKIAQFKLNEALSAIWMLLTFPNGYIDQKKPWKTIDDDPNEFLRTITSITRLIIEVSYLLEPFIPETAEKIQKIFNLKDKIKKWEGTSIIVGGIKPLFPRLEK
nr:methionine--tRNA ligase [Bacteroidota bacterium]